MGGIHEPVRTRRKNNREERASAQSSLRRSTTNYSVVRGRDHDAPAAAIIIMTLPYWPFAGYNCSTPTFHDDTCDFSSPAPLRQSFSAPRTPACGTPPDKTAGPRRRLSRQGESTDARLLSAYAFQLTQTERFIFLRAYKTNRCHDSIYRKCSTWNIKNRQNGTASRRVQQKGRMSPLIGTARRDPAAQAHPGGARRPGQFRAAELPAAPRRLCPHFLSRISIRPARRLPNQEWRRRSGAFPRDRSRRSGRGVRRYARRTAAPRRRRTGKF